MTEQQILTFTKLQPVFERHEVPEEDRSFLYEAFETLMEQNCPGSETAAMAIEEGFLAAEAYDDLLLIHNRKHRKNKAWLRSCAYGDADLTNKGRALLRDLAAVNPDWQDHPEAA